MFDVNKMLNVFNVYLNQIFTLKTLRLFWESYNSDSSFPLQLFISLLDQLLSKKKDSGLGNKHFD